MQSLSVLHALLGIFAHISEICLGKMYFHAAVSTNHRCIWRCPAMDDERRPFFKAWQPTLHQDQKKRRQKKKTPPIAWWPSARISLWCGNTFCPDIFPKYGQKYPAGHKAKEPTNSPSLVRSGQKYPAGHAVQLTDPAKAKEPPVHGIAKSTTVCGHMCPAKRHQHNEAFG